ncbi:hypothetical protein SDC9_210990 [bioreactor metagenome]|uniref:Uncharacterized protein n=1 Tax=bioreactor metagenome TaxID=1076179 RepID=A0A645JVH5_9ZZZZ
MGLGRGGLRRDRRGGGAVRRGAAAVSGALLAGRIAGDCLAGGVAAEPPGCAAAALDLAVGADSGGGRPDGVDAGVSAAAGAVGRARKRTLALVFDRQYRGRAALFME